MRVLAVDLGATSVRVATVDLPDDGAPTVRVVHRHPNAPVAGPDGSLRWDWDRLVAEVVRGLEAALREGQADSIGIDTWGVDYGLLDAGGRLLSPPHSYRDRRTDGWRAVARRLGEATLYDTSGIQLMAINTVFQLAAHDRGELRRARHLLLLPELLASSLTGEVTGEVTSAGTTGLVDVRTGTWSAALLDDLDVDLALMPEIARAGTRLGAWRGVPVHLVAGHDTASAVAALPGAPLPGAAFVCSGTWLLVGAERATADTSPAARAANFSNEPGALGGVRFLRNVVGLGLLEACRTAWPDVTMAQLGREAAAAPAGGPVIDAGDLRFADAADVAREVRVATGLPDSAGRGAIARCVLDSLAAAAAAVVAEVATLTGTAVPEVHLLGGGTRLPLFVRLLAEACGVPVRVGSAEATALGNALVQGIALGRYEDLADARRAII